MTTKTKAAKTVPSAKANTPAPANLPANPKGYTLETPPDAPGRTHDQFMAQGAADGIVGNARAVVTFGKGTFGELSLTDCAAVLKATAKSLNDGDLSAAVTMLAAQAVALNAMFGELARVAQVNMFKEPDYADRYMRLAFKAQGQSRATLETLAAIKNPPVLFARQANINNGGQQQVNNGTAPAQAANSTQACASARPGETVSSPNELLEERTHGSPQLDTRATKAAGRKNQSLEPVGKVHWAAHR